MDLVDLIYAVAALASVVASVLAWLAKIRWSREYGAAKDEVIRAKEAQIAVLNEKLQMLSEFNSAKILEHFQTTKRGLEDYIEVLKRGQEAAEAALADKDQAIATLQADGTRQSAELVRLNQERNRLQEAVVGLRGQLELSHNLVEVEGAALSHGVDLQAFWRQNEEVSVHLNLLLHTLYRSPDQTSKLQELLREYATAENRLFYRSLFSTQHIIPRHLIPPEARDQPSSREQGPERPENPEKSKDDQ